jgi:hypothetical protein
MEPTYQHISLSSFHEKTTLHRRHSHSFRSVENDESLLNGSSQLGIGHYCSSLTGNTPYSSSSLHPKMSSQKPMGESMLKDGVKGELEYCRLEWGKYQARWMEWLDLMEDDAEVVEYLVDVINQQRAAARLSS